MSPLDVRVVALVAELERDWKRVRLQSERAQSVDPRQGGPEAAYVALALDHAYQGFEQILLRLERGLGLPERSGASWQRALLTDAAMALPNVRPAVLPAPAEREWEHLLGFRHFLRHAYGTDLDPIRLARNADRLERAVAATDPVLQELLEALATE